MMTFEPPEQDVGGPLSEIEVTAEMLDAGMAELAEHRLLDDPRYVLECVFRAMAYVRERASSISASK